jgi:hypothetical protein
MFHFKFSIINVIKFKRKVFNEIINNNIFYIDDFINDDHIK